MAVNHLEWTFFSSSSKNKSSPSWICPVSERMWQPLPTLQEEWGGHPGLGLCPRARVASPGRWRPGSTVGACRCHTEVSHARECHRRSPSRLPCASALVVVATGYRRAVLQKKQSRPLRPLPGLRRPRFSVSATQQADVSKEVKLLFFVCCLLISHFPDVKGRSVRVLGNLPDG